jgi:general secretion pathway protein B
MYFFFQQTVDKKISIVPDSKTAAPNDVPPNTRAVTPTPTSDAPFSATTVKSISDAPVPKTGTAPVQPEKIIPKEDVKPKQSPVGNAERIERKPAPSARTVRLSELPEEIRKVLPEFKVSAHFYSPDVKARFARINDRILHEGDSLNEGLKVEEINSNGTVFNYQGHRFIVGINQN